MWILFTWKCKLDLVSQLYYVNLSDMIGQTSEVSTKVSPMAGMKLKGKAKSEMTLLDLYAGSGAMSTGLCLGAATSGVDLVTVSMVRCVLALSRIFFYLYDSL